MCNIMPGHILKHIVTHGTDEQRKHATHSLSSSSRLRGRRDIQSARNSVFGMGMTNTTLTRALYDASGHEDLPGRLIRQEGGPATTDLTGTEAYDAAGIAHDFYKTIFGRNSIDNHGQRIDSTIHYSDKLNNAFWEGVRMVYGDGDGILFNRFTVDICIIIHEITHGLTQNECNLVYYGQPGWLNEAGSDVFGVVGRHWFEGTYTMAKDANWVVGLGLFTPQVKGRGLRDLAAPGTAYDDPVLGKDIQPAHMRDVVDTREDDGGVHINSGIAAHSFFILCDELPGVKSWEAPIQLWYKTWQHLNKQSGYKDCATIMAQMAIQLYGAESKEEKAVKNSWSAVGIELGSALSTTT